MSIADTLRLQGRASDYSSRKKLYEEMGLGGQYGSYTGSANQNIAFENLVRGGKPSPKQASTPTVSQPTQTPSLPNNQAGGSIGGFNVGKLTPLQQQYMTAYQNQPSQSGLYNQYANELGIPQQLDVVTGLTRTILDVEGKIKAVEGNVKERTKDFLVTEAQRSRIQTTEEQPLREQYLEALRRKEYEEAGLVGKERLLDQRLKYATAEAERPLGLLKELIGWEKDKASGSGGLNLGGLETDIGAEEPKPTTVPGQSDTSANTLELLDQSMGGLQQLTGQAQPAQRKPLGSMSWPQINVPDLVVKGVNYIKSKRSAK